MFPGDGDPVWVTVEDRERLDQGSLLVRFMGDVRFDEMMKLVGSTFTAVESPVYFRAVSPALYRLQSLAAIDESPLHTDVADARPSHSAFVPAAFSAVTGIVDHGPPDTTASAVDVESLTRFATRPPGSAYALDPSQESAVREAFSNSIGLVQGPPGTGKTLLSTRMVQALLHFRATTKPILVLTQKNHALDQFLLACKAFCEPGRLVRVGGRAAADLDDMNLNSLLRQKGLADQALSQAQYDRRKECRQQLTEAEQELKPAAAQLTVLMDPTPKSDVKVLLQHCLPDALLSLWPDDEAAPDGDLLAWVMTVPREAARAPKPLKAAVRSWCLPVHKSTKQAGKQPPPPAAAPKPPARSFALLVDDLDEQQRLWDLAGSDDDDDGDDDDDDHVDAAGRKRDKLAGKTRLTLGHRTDVTATASRPNGPSPTHDLLSDLSAAKDATSRRHILRLVRESAAHDAVADVQRLMDVLKPLSAELHELSLAKKKAILQNAQVVGLTMTGAAIHSALLAQVQPEVVLVEEAAEVLEASLLAALPASAEHLIMIGDHQQLRPQVEVHDPLVTKCRFDISMFERLVTAGAPYKTLTRQGRMRHEMSLPLTTVYDTYESNPAAIAGLAPLRCTNKSFFVLAHTEFEERHKGAAPAAPSTSHVNKYEVGAVAKLVAHLVAQGVKPKDVAVLATYKGQVAELRTKLAAVVGDAGHARLPVLRRVDDASDPPETVEWGSVRVATVDQFQGDEADVVVVSLVRSNPENNAGFVASRNRMTVAFSRARRAAFYLGNFEMLRSVSRPWREFLDTVPDGCIGRCSDLLLSCERHPSHRGVPLSVSLTLASSVCTLPCTATYRPCGHPCNRMCHGGTHPDGKCPHRLQVSLRCGHMSALYKCSDGPAPCGLPCDRKMPCGHLCPRRCGVACPASNPECADCLKLADARRNQEVKAAAAKIREARAMLQQEVEAVKKEANLKPCIVVPLPPDDHEFIAVKQQVEASVSPHHPFVLNVLEVNRVSNPTLELAQKQARLKMVDPTRPPQRKFHGTTADAAESIVKTGFRLPSPKPGRPPMFGQGVYFASNSSKSAQTIYTKTSKHATLLVCNVYLGQVRPMVEADPKAHERAQRERLAYDSVYAKPNSRAGSGCLHDEFVIYDARLALPEYVVKLDLVNGMQVSMPSCDGAGAGAAAGGAASVQRRRILRPRNLTTMNIHDPDEVLFRMIESQYLRQSQDSWSRVKEVIVVNSPTVAVRFEKMKKRLRARKEDTELVFHGTPQENVDKILEGGFMIGGVGVPVAVGTAAGQGVYVGLQPDISKGYNRGSKTLIAALVVRGPSNGHMGHSTEPDPGHNDCSPTHLVIHHQDQLWPRFAVTFE